MPRASLLRFILAILAATLAVANPASAKTILAYEKSIPIGDEPFHFEWSYDSEHIVVWASHGTFAIVDIADGTLHKIEPTTSGVEALAWSPDGHKVALDNVTDLRVVDARDLDDLKVIKAPAADIRFGGPMAFSDDGNSLFVASAGRATMLYRVDLKTNEIVPLINLSGSSGKRIFAKNGRFIRSNGKLYLSLVVTYYEKSEVGSWRPYLDRISCHVFDLSASPISDRSVSVDNPAFDKRDGSGFGRDINTGGCAYLPALNFITVHRDALSFYTKPGVPGPRTMPIAKLSEDPVFRAADRAVEIFDIATGESVAAFGGLGANRGGIIDIDTHPTEPLVAASVVKIKSLLGTEHSAVRLFDARNGSEVASLDVPPFLWKVRFAPDGRRFAVIAGRNLQIYRIGK